MAFCLGDRVLVMTICDNGRGGLALHGNGIGGMRERALRGRLSIDSPLRHGTVLHIRVPAPVRAGETMRFSAVDGGDSAWPIAGSAA